ncbi:ribonuclease H-like domain-containing protein [Tanacetum coccineum]
MVILMMIKFVHDMPTIRKLDISDPLHLHPNDSAAFIVISVKLKGTENYQVWSCAMLLALEGKNKTGFIDATCTRSNTYERPQTYGNIARPSNVTRPSTSGNRRPTGGPHLVCEKCRFNGYTIGRCFKIIRFPRDFGKKNDSNNNAQNGYNFKKRFVNNNSENSGNTVEKDVHANMAARLIVDYGANQHRTYSDKFLVNVIDISKFGIKVSHTNETEALITNVGNMVLTKDITLYDVLVVLEYCGLREMKCLGDCSDKISSRSEKCVLVGYSGFKKGYKLFRLDRKQFIFLRDVKNFENVFPFKTGNNYVPNSDVNQGLNHVNFFNEIHIGDPDVPYDDINDNGIDLNETFYPVVKLVTIRCLINLFLQNNWSLFQLDINNAFLYDDLSETVYMSLPNGYFDKNDKRSKSDYSLFTKSDSGMFLALLVYVDDIIITGNSLVHIEEFKFSLACKPSVVPLEQNLKISNEPTASDPAVHLPKIVMHKPLKSHLKIALKVLRYLKGSLGKGVHIVRCPKVSLETFVDADWAKCLVTRRSITGFNLHEWVEFQGISLTEFRSCTSRSHYRSISKQTTRYPCEASHGHKIEN